MGQYDLLHLERARPALKRMSHLPDAERVFTLSDFDFQLPPELIAQHPAPERSASRLLDGRTLPPTDRIFHELPSLLRPGDLLVFNDTKVVKARLYGEKPTGGKLELLVERVLTNHEVVAHMKVSKKPPVGTVLRMGGGDVFTAGPPQGENAPPRGAATRAAAERGGTFTAELLGRWPDEHGQLFHLHFSDEPHRLMEQHGHVPLPPYIEHGDTAEDASRYQTVFAAKPGAAAAPTAALHFDEGVLAALEAHGVQRANVTLHVGAGTFSPVKTENIAEHQMHSEWYEVPAATRAAIAETRARGGRIVAVGTTTVRTLESWAKSGQASGDTSIFITPGFQFQLVDLLITNFHLPKSTLMMLVSALAGYEHVMTLYRHAIAQRYRFFSYGDAMLLERSR
jgi:S-adenosylmethionine:tRNA ribosyltransferase-isomerase